MTRLFLICLFLPLALWAQDHSSVETQPVSLEDLDLILQRAQNISQFLASAELQEEYYLGLRSYFGGEERFPRDAYYKLIGQLKDVNSRFPEIASRAWQKPSVAKSFEIEISLKSSGLLLKPTEFKTWLENWKMKLKSLHTNLTDEQLLRSMQSLHQEISAFYLETANLPRAQRQQRLGPFFSKLTSRPIFKEIVARSIIEKLEEEHIKDRLGSGDADTVLYTFSDLRGGGDFNLFGQPLPSEFQSLIARAIPSLETPKLGLDTQGKPLESEIFRVETITTKRGKIIPVGQSSRSVFLFRTLPRLIHGIFKGIPIKECVAGNTGSLESITPERWASLLIDGTDFYHIEKISDNGDSYQGFVQLVPGIVGDKNYVSADLGSPLFAKKIIGISTGAEILFDLWLQEAIEHLDVSVSGIILSDTLAVDNSGVLPRIWRRPSYLFGRVINAFDHFVVSDNLAKKLSSLGIRAGLATHYAGRMIFDAVVPQVKKLTLLNPKLKAFPTSLSLQEFLNLLQESTESNRESLLVTMLLARVKPLSEADRSFLLSVATTKKISSDSAIAIYSSNLIETPTEDEIQFLSTLKSDGLKLIKKKAPNSMLTLELRMDELNSDPSLLDSTLEKISLIPNHITLLTHYLQSSNRNLAAAVLLLALGKSDEKSDSVVIKMLKSDNTFPRSAHWGRLAKHYLENVSPLRDDLLKALINFGIVSDSDEIVSFALKTIGERRMMDTALQSRIESAIASAQSTSRKLTLASILFSNGSAPVSAQRLYLSQIGEDDSRQKNIRALLSSLPQISPEAMPALGERLVKADTDETNRLLAWVRDNYNLPGTALVAVFAPLMTHERERVRVNATRILATQGLLSPALEDKFLDELVGREYGYRTLQFLSNRFQISQKNKDRLIARIEQDSMPDYCSAILVLQNQLSPSNKIKLQELENHPNPDVRYAAARTLFLRGDSSLQTLTVLLDKEKSNRYGSTDLEKIEKVTRNQPISGTEALVLTLLQFKKVKAYETLKSWAATSSDISVPGFTQAEIREFLDLVKMDPANISEDQALLLGRMITSVEFPAKDEAYQLLKKASRLPQSEDFFKAALDSTSASVRFYSALILARRFSIWDGQIEQALLLWTNCPDIPAEAKWSAEAQALLISNLKNYGTKENSSLKGIFRILKSCRLTQASLDYLIPQARDRGSQWLDAYTVLKENINTHESAEVRSYLGLPDPAEEVTAKKETYLKQMETEKNLADASIRLSQISLSTVELERLRKILTRGSADSRVAAAFVLSVNNEWTEEIQSELLDYVRKDGSGYSLYKSRNFLFDILKKRGVTIKLVRSLVGGLIDAKQAGESFGLLRDMRLSGPGIAVIRRAQDSSNRTQRSFAAALLMARGAATEKSRRILWLDGHSAIGTSWLVEHLKGFDPNPRDVELFFREVRKSAPKEANPMLTLIRDFKNPGPNFLRGMQSALFSDELEVRLFIADHLPTKNMSTRQQEVLVEYLIKYPKIGVFEKLEGITSLSAHSQLLLAQSIVATNPSTETYAVRLLVNQLELAPAALQTLLQAQSNILVREILASKKKSAISKPANPNCSAIFLSH